MENTAQRPELMKAARDRVAFKAHFIIFVLGNIMIWLLWILLYYIFNVTFPWALFPTLGWGVAIAFHYFKVFRWNEKWVQQEYEKLVREHKSHGQPTNENQQPPTLNV